MQSTELHNGKNVSVCFKVNFVCFLSSRVNYTLRPNSPVTQHVLQSKFIPTSVLLVEQLEGSVYLAGSPHELRMAPLDLVLFILFTGASFILCRGFTLTLKVVIYVR